MIGEDEHLPDGWHAPSEVPACAFRVAALRTCVIDLRTPGRGNAIRVQSAGDGTQAGSGEELLNDPTNNHRLPRTRPQLARHNVIAIRAFGRPSAEPSAGLACLRRSPRHVVGLGAGLLGKQADDQPCARLSRVETFSDEHDSTADPLEFVEEQPDCAHPLTCQAIDLRDVEDFDLLAHQRRDGSPEPGALAVSPSRGVQVRELFYDFVAIAYGALTVQFALPYRTGIEGRVSRTVDRDPDEPASTAGGQGGAIRRSSFCSLCVTEPASCLPCPTVPQVSSTGLDEGSNIRVPSETPSGTHARQRPTDRRRQPRGTMGLLRIEGGRLLEAEIVPVT